MAKTTTTGRAVRMWSVAYWEPGYGFRVFQTNSKAEADTEIARLIAGGYTYAVTTR